MSGSMRTVCAGCGVHMHGDPDAALVSHGACSVACFTAAAETKERAERRPLARVVVLSATRCLVITHRGVELPFTGEDAEDQAKAMASTINAELHAPLSEAGRREVEQGVPDLERGAA